MKIEGVVGDTKVLLLLMPAKGKDGMDVLKKVPKPKVAKEEIPEENHVDG